MSELQVDIEFRFDTRQQMNDFIIRLRSLMYDIGYGEIKQAVASEFLDTSVKETSRK